MRMGQGVWTGVGHGVITCVLQTQFSSLNLFLHLKIQISTCHKFAIYLRATEICSST